MATQVSHASMAFLTNSIKRNSNPIYAFENDEKLIGYAYKYVFDKELYESWINGTFTKIVCQAKNKNDLLKCINIANDLNLKENEDYFLIKDNCLTELTPEEYDDNGVGRCLTCIGFKPLRDDIMKQISKKYQLYKD